MKRVGCLDCHLIEPSAGVWVDGRCPICRKRRGLGPSRGRPKTRIRTLTECAACGNRFEWLSDGKSGRQFCGIRCHLKAQRDSRRKLPSETELRDLYVKQRISTPKIAEMFGATAKSVNQALKKYGIPMRRKTVALDCSVDGCKNRVKKLKHPINGSLYGTLCGLHRFEHRKQVSKAYRSRQRKGV